MKQNVFNDWYIAIAPRARAGKGVRRPETMSHVSDAHNSETMIMPGPANPRF